MWERFVERWGGISSLYFFKIFLLMDFRQEKGRESEREISICCSLIYTFIG